MNIQHFTPANRTTINWASGTSTEIFIYPHDGNFVQRNFVFRISMATVEADESVFTFFEGITRHLMILKGELELIHEGRYTKHLKPFDQDVFSGEWSTRSKGRVTDFNLMLKDGATGSLTPHHLKAGDSASFIAETECFFLYLASGIAAFDNGRTANAGDLLMINKDSEVNLHAENACNLIVIEVEITRDKM